MAFALRQSYVSVPHKGWDLPASSSSVNPKKEEKSFLKDTKCSLSNLFQTVLSLAQPENKSCSHLCDAEMRASVQLSSQVQGM